MTTLTTDPPAPIDLRGSPRRHRRERVVRGVFVFAGVSSLVISVAIVASLIGDSVTFLTNIDLSSLWTSPHRWAPRFGRFDLLTVFMGSLIVTGIAMLVAIPLGIGAAFSLAEYATARVRRLLKPVLEVLAGIPSIVLGFFAVAWIGPNIVQSLWTDADTFSLAGRAFQSRLIIGTGKYASFAETRRAADAAGVEIVTVAVRRVNIVDPGKENLLDHLPLDRFTILPNTAGCYTAADAVRTCRLAREAGVGKLVKLEVIGDEKTLFPDVPATLEAAKILVDKITERLKTSEK